MAIIDEAMLDRFRGPGKCEFCGKHVKRREPHHLHSRGFGGGLRFDVAINLISLCATFSGGDNCHHLAHNAKIKRDALIAIVAAREGIAPAELLDQIYLLRRRKRQ